MIDSAGLGELIVAFISGQISGRPVKFAAPTRLVRKILEITNLNSVFNIYERVEDAAMSQSIASPANAQRLGAAL